MEPRILLQSGRSHPRWARESLCAAVGGPALSLDGWHDGDPLQRLEEFLRARPGVPCAGYLSYDLARGIERLPARAADDRRWPLLHFAAMPDCRRLQAGPQPAPAGAFRADPPQARTSRAMHEAAVAKALDYIGAGDVFQVNLCQRFSAAWRGDPALLHARLMQAAPAWYGALLPIPPARAEQPWRWLVSASPELFLEWPGDGTLVTRPIKGTRPASASAAELAGSEKDAAELHMIVDLMRNDLGRVCAFGSVRLDEPRHVESHPTVHHGVATLSGRLRPDAGLAAVLRAAFPGGSVTGAPKVRAMEIIDELEPVRRGPYCGAFGWLQAEADGSIRGCLAMTIRTVLLEGRPRDGADGPFAGTLDFSVGGGIVADSSPAAEYEETLHKAAALLAALRGD